MRKMVLICGLLACLGSAQASKKCGNSWIADNKTCHVGVGTPYTPPAPAQPVYTPSPAPVSVLTKYGNCRDARAAGWADIRLGSANYRDEFDRDHDGIACESGGDDDGASVASAPAAGAVTTPAGSPASPQPPRSPVVCPAFKSSVAWVPVDGRMRSQPVTVYDVQGVMYVSVADFACANGLGYLNEAGWVTVADTRRTLLLMDGMRAKLGGAPHPLTANILSIREQVSAPFADLLNVFNLTAKGLTFKAESVVPDYGGKPF